MTSKLCLSPVAVFHLKYGGCDVSEIESWSTMVRIKLGEGVHNLSMLLVRAE